MSVHALAVLQIFLGLAGLGLGGDVLVRGAVGMAERLRISPLVTGLILVGFGTSVPELVTSLSAALKGSDGIAFGNVVGSNIANILLILGLTAVIFPITIDRKSYQRDGPALAIVTILFVICAVQGEIGRLTGLAFLTGLSAFVGYSYLAERRKQDAQARLHVRESTALPPIADRIWLNLALAVAGIALVILGARWMVAGSVTLARGIGLSETAIGLTVVAVGTSLPELATSIMAALRRQTDIAVGNIIGSNIFNVLGILGVVALVAPIEASPDYLLHDLSALALSAALLVGFIAFGAKLSRASGAAFLALYMAYTAHILMRASTGA